MQNPLRIFSAMAAASVAGAAEECSINSMAFAFVQLEKAVLHVRQCSNGEDTCKIIGDPHVTRFDRKWVSLMNVNDTSSNIGSDTGAQEPGTYYVVKDSKIDIQATFGGNGPVMTRLAIGGSLVGSDGKTIIIEPTLVGGLTFNGNEILQSVGDELSTDDFTAVFTANAPLIQRSNADGKTTNGYVFTFAEGVDEDYLRVTVNRRDKSLNVAISRCQDDDMGYHSDVQALPETTAIGMCGRNDDGTTVSPEENLAPMACESGTCNVYGDPHITNFHRRWMSLFQADGSAHGNMHTVTDQEGIQKAGHFWLVKSKSASIQAKFGRNGPMMTHLAVGGAILNGSVLIIGAAKGEVTWNGRTILTEFPSSFKSADGLAVLSFSNQTALVQRKDQLSQTVPGVHVQLPQGVELTVNRMARSINAAITMCQDTSDTFSGYCGNDNADDVMLAEDESPYEVAEPECLFPRDIQ